MHSLRLGTSSQTKHTSASPRRITNLVHGLLAAIVGFGHPTKADEITVPAGVSVLSATLAQLNIIQNTAQACVDLGINTAPGFSGQRLALVNTRGSTTLDIPSGQELPVYTFGEHERFFARINANGNPEISTDLTSWFPYSSGTVITPSREESDTTSDMSSRLTTVEELTENQQALQTQLALEQQTLGTLQTTLNQVSSQLSLTSTQLNSTQDTLANKESEQETLIEQLQPESQLRSDIHPVAGNPNLGDDIKTTSTQNALNTYDTASNLQSALRSKTQSTQRSFSAQASFTPPTASEIASTKNLLAQELSRLQTQINDVNSQITAKQNEITTTQSTITALEQSIANLTTQINQYTSNYVYWRDEYTRLNNLATTKSNLMTVLRSDYSSQRSRLTSEAGRNDVPSNMDASNFLDNINQLKTTINNEMSAIGIPSNQWWSDTTTKNRSTMTSSTTTRMDGSYYYTITYNSLAKSFPAVIRIYTKAVWKSSYTLSTTTYTVYNDNHIIAVASSTVHPLAKKFCDYAYVRTILEETAANYVQAKTEYNIHLNESATAFNNRNATYSQLDTALILNTQRQNELATQQTQKNLLTQQKSELDALKALKANLQSLYNRVQTILTQLQSHVASYDQLSDEIDELLALWQTLKNQVDALTPIVAAMTEEVAVQHQKVLWTNTLINEKTEQLTAEQNELLAKIARMDIKKPRDQISDKNLTYPQIAQYFSYGHRTSKGPVNLLTGFTVDSLVQYLDNGTPEDIYPAKLFYRYTINGNVYFTDAHEINNLEHKWAMGDMQKNALIQLKLALDISNWIGDVNQNMRLMWESIRTELGKLTTPTVTNTSLRDYYNDRNTITRDILMTGGSQTFFDHLIATDATFKGKIDTLVATVATNNGIETGSDQYADLTRTLTHILARQFGEQLVSQNFSGLTTYTHYSTSASSFITSVTNTINSVPNTVDINDTWEVDTHGNKYRFGLYGTAYPKTLWMNYSPDGQNTQTMWPVRVQDASELNDWKERYQKDLLATKKSHTKYNGGAYDIFQGWDEKGQKVWWSMVRRSDNVVKSTSFSSSLQIAEWTAKELTKVAIPENFTSNEVFFRSLFGLDYASFEQQANASLKQLIQITDQQLSLQIGNITNSSFDVSLLSSSQKELSKVIISLTGISGFNAADVKAFQLRAINQLARLWADYEQDIIHDTMNNGRNGDMEEIRAMVVLQKLSALFIEKWLEMSTLNSSGKILQASSIALTKYNIDLEESLIWIKRLYFATEEWTLGSNIKRNGAFINLSSLNEGEGFWGRIYFLNRNIDLSTMGNVLLWYNAKKIGFSLEETILWALAAQTWTSALQESARLYQNWDKHNGDMWDLITSLQYLPISTILNAFNNEIEDKAHYTEWYNINNTSPSSLLKILTN